MGISDIRVGIGCLFATGNNLNRDAILHIGGTRYSSQHAPVEKDWILNTMRPVTMRVHRLSRISAGESRKHPDWEGLRADIQGFFSNLDVLFVAGIARQPDWFNKRVIGDIHPRPVVVDLLEMYQFFCLDKEVAYTEDAVMARAAKRTGPTLPRFRDGLESMLLEVLASILAREQCPEPPVVGLLRTALRVVEGGGDYCVGVGCLLTEGDDISQDCIIQIAGTRYSTKHARTDIEVKRYPFSKKSKARIRNFFGEMDVLLVPGTACQPDWFRSRVLKGVKKRPEVVDLFKLMEFFCLSQEVRTQALTIFEHLPGSGADVFVPIRKGLSQVLSMVIETVRQNAPACGGSEFSKFFVGLKRILAEREQCKTWMIAPVFGLLSQACAAREPPEDMKAMHRIAEAADRIRWDHGFAGLRYEAPPVMLESGLNALVKRLKVNRGSEIVEREKAVEQRVPIKECKVNDFLRDMASGRPNFNERQEQMEFAKFCAEAINEPAAYVAEAGTGTGKTLGYLIPACEFARCNSTRMVVIATSTNNLLQQICQKDWQLIQGTERPMYRNLRIKGLKDKSHYLCLGGLKSLYLGRRSKHGSGSALVRLSWLYFFLVLNKCRGHVGEIPFRLTKRFPDLSGSKTEFNIYSAVNAEKVCLPGVCSVGLECVYPTTCESAEQANILVTNHHKIVSLGDSIEQRQAVWIIDEADRFPDNLRSAFSVTVSRSRLEHFVEKMMGSRYRTSFIKQLRRQFQHDEHRNAGFLNDLASIELECNKLRRLAEKTNTSVTVGKYPVRWNDLCFSDREALKRTLKQMEQCVGAITTCWVNISQKWNRIAPPDQKVWQRAWKGINHVSREAKALEKDLGRLDGDISSADYLFVFEAGAQSWEASRVPFCLSTSGGRGSEFVQALWNSEKSVIFTSATLFVDKRLDFFEKELFGSSPPQEPFKQHKRVRSPFQYNTQAHGAVASFMPWYKHSKSDDSRGENWKAEVARTIALLCVAINGRTLTLFTNFSEMRETYDTIKGTLKDHDIQPLLQRGTSRSQIETFRVQEQSAMFGVDRFWTGVDFPGPTLSQVIAVKLPNPGLSQPMVKHRKDHWSEDEFWKQWYEPQTRLKLRQGFGRLIRRCDDRGIFVLLDIRVTERPLNHALSALPIILEGGTGSALELSKWAIKKLKLSTELKSRNVDLKALHQQLANQYFAPRSQGQLT